MPRYNIVNEGVFFEGFGVEGEKMRVFFFFFDGFGVEGEKGGELMFDSEKHIYNCISYYIIRMRERKTHTGLYYTIRMEGTRERRKMRKEIL